MMCCRLKVLAIYGVVGLDGVLLVLSIPSFLMVDLVGRSFHLGAFVKEIDSPPSFLYWLLIIPYYFLRHIILLYKIYLMWLVSLNVLLVYKSISLKMSCLVSILIHIDEIDFQWMLSNFGCKYNSWSSSYLGMPLVGNFKTGISTSSC